MVEPLRHHARTLLRAGGLCKITRNRDIGDAQRRADTGTLSGAKLVLMFLLAWALIAVLVFASGGSARLPAELAQRLGAVAADWHFAVALPAVAGWLTLAVFVEPDRWSQGLPVLPHLAKILRPPLSGLRNT